MADNTTPSSTYPYNMPVSFRFDVKIAGITGAGECLFQEVSGLNAKLTSETIIEAGTDKVYKMPTSVTYDNLLLKRGLLKGSLLTAWINDAFRFRYEPKQVDIKLLDENNAMIISWTLYDAYPVSVRISELKAMDNSVVIETLEMAYSYYVRN